MDDEPKMIKVRVSVSTDKVGSRVSRDIDVYSDEWNDMDERERYEFAMETLWSLIEWGYEVVGDDAERDARKARKRR